MTLDHYRVKPSSFGHWVDQVPERIADLEKLYPELALDYSADSLALIADKVLEIEETVGIFADENEILAPALWTYCGEVYRRHTGGTWDQNSTDEDYAFFMVPCIKVKDWHMFDPSKMLSVIRHKNREFMKELMLKDAEAYS